MATQTITANEPLKPGKVLSATGWVTVIFSLAAGLLVLFVLPGRCSFLGGLEIFLLAVLLVFGLIALLSGKILSRFSR